MSALVGATVTAILAAAAAFSMGGSSAHSRVRTVTDTTDAARATTTVSEPDTTLTTIFVPQGVDVPASAPHHITSDPAATTTTASTTTTSNTIAPPPQPVTVSHAPAVAHVVWNVSPAGLTVQSGAQFRVTIAATNEGNAAGSVTVPPCPAKPIRYSPTAARSAGNRRPATNTCHPGSQTLIIRPGQRDSWTDTISATSDATRYGTPLAAGDYIVAVNATPSPIMFLRMNASA